MSYTYQQQEERALARIIRPITLAIEVKGAHLVYVESELYFNFRALFAVQGFRIESVKLRVNAETTITPQWFQYVPQREERCGDLRIYFNGVRVFTKRTYDFEVHNIELDIDPSLVRSETRVRVELEPRRVSAPEPLASLHATLKVTRCEIDLIVSVPESQLDSLAVAEQISVNDNKRYLESVINIPSPNKTVTPTSTDPISSFFSILGQLPNIIIAMVILFVLIELIRAFRR